MFEMLWNCNTMESVGNYDYSINSIIDVLRSKESSKDNIKYLRLKTIWSYIIAQEGISYDDFLFFINFLDWQVVSHFIQDFNNPQAILTYAKNATINSYLNWLISQTRNQLTNALVEGCKKWQVYPFGNKEFVITWESWDSSIWELINKFTYVKLDKINQKAYSLNRMILETQDWYEILVDDNGKVILQWDSISQTFDDLLLVKSYYKKHIYNCDGEIVYGWIEYFDEYKIQDENYLAKIEGENDKIFSLVNVDGNEVFGGSKWKQIQKSFSDNWIDYISGISWEDKFVIVDINGSKIYENSDSISRVITVTNSPFVIWVRDSKGNVIFIKDKQICKLKLDLPFNCSIWTIKLMESIFVVYEQEWKKIDKIVSLEWNELFQRYFEENPWLTKFKLQYYFIIDGVGYLFCFEQKDNKEKTYVIMDSQWNIRFGSENSKEIHEIKKTLSDFYIAEITKNKKKFLKSTPFTNYYDLNGGIVDINQLDLLVWVKKHKVVKESSH